MNRENTIQNEFFLHRTGEGQSGPELTFPQSATLHKLLLSVPSVPRTDAVAIQSEQNWLRSLPAGKCGSTDSLNRSVPHSTALVV